MTKKRPKQKHEIEEQKCCFAGLIAIVKPIKGIVYKAMQRKSKPNRNAVTHKTTQIVPQVFQNAFQEV